MYVSLLVLNKQRITSKQNTVELVTSIYEKKCFISSPFPESPHADFCAVSATSRVFVKNLFKTSRFSFNN